MSDRHVVVRSISRAAEADIEALAAYGTATVHEAIGRRGFLGPDLRPIQDGVSIEYEDYFSDEQGGNNSSLPSTLTLLAFRTDGSETIVTTTTTGNFPGSPLVFRWHVGFAGDRIASLRI